MAISARSENTSAIRSPYLMQYVAEQSWFNLSDVEISYILDWLLIEDSDLVQIKWYLQSIWKSVLPLIKEWMTNEALLLADAIFNRMKSSPEMHLIRENFKVCIRNREHISIHNTEWMERKANMDNFLESVKAETASKL